jgi:NhaA family Na+:H+ antiporter
MLSFLKHTFLHPLQEFIHDSRAIGIVLLTCTALSLLLANLPLTSSSYQHLWQVSFDGYASHHMHIGALSLPNAPLLVINDLLMAVFFLLAGMEIKRELTSGELSSFKQALLPVIAALGGMAMPALLFMWFNHGTTFAKGWAIPTATDIAFTLGVASLLGKRVPVALKVFLTALAIIDDLGAIVVIALFYGGNIQLLYLCIAAVVMLLLVLLNKFKPQFGWLHVLLSIVLWYSMYNSGIHATIAGVLLAFTIPVKQLERLELKLHVPVYFIIMPLFALANTAIVIPPSLGSALNSSLSWGIIAGLFIGKPLGICVAAWLFIKLKWAKLPNDTKWLELMGGSVLAGIGFTMSIFIATLAFDTPAMQDVAKISVLLASFLAMLVGYIWLKLVKK